MRILVVDDDRAVREALRRALTLGGYEVQVAEDGEQALELIAQSVPDTVVLDLGLPGIDGLEVCRRIRRLGNRVPILILTARDAVADRIDGLDVGADDYMVKPFDFPELLARLRALQRRPKDAHPPQLAVGDLVYDAVTRSVSAAGTPVNLTQIELSILEVLVQRAPAVVTRQSIAVHVWQYEADAVGSNTIDVHVAHLRSKLAPACVRIDTLRGVGYRLVPA